MPYNPHLPDETEALAAAVPPHTLMSLRAYAIDRRPVGSFLNAVLSNDLFKAVGHADAYNFVCLRAICQYVHSVLPAPSWGSPEKVRAWLAHRGETPTEDER